MQDQAVIQATAGGSPGPAAALAADLEALGFELLAGQGRPALPHGVAQRISVQTVLQEGAAAERFFDRLAELCSRSIPVCLSVSDFGRYAGAALAWRRFCEAIRRTGDDRAVAVTDIGFCMHSHQLPLETYCEVPDSLLGAGPRYVFLDSLQMRAHCNRRVEARTRENWTFLWRSHRRSRPVAPVYGGFVRSACPLLAEEAATTILPGTGLHIPDHSAWLPIRMRLTAFADDAGRLDLARLLQALQQVVATADRLLDLQSWPARLQNADARENRRLAVILSDIGELVERRGNNPADLHCLRELTGMLGQIRETLIAASAALANQAGEVPALARACPAGDWFNGSHGEVWRRRFDAARRKSAVRHRNLLVMSPYAVLPSRPLCPAAYTDLLPLLSYADAWSFADPPPLRGWNVTQFKDFHRRARAVIQGAHAVSRVAAGA